VIGFDGKMNALAGKYAGLDRFECRRQIVADMQALGPDQQDRGLSATASALCYRCRTVVEPTGVAAMVRAHEKTWQKPAIEAVRSGRHPVRSSHVGAIRIMSGCSIFVIGASHGRSGGGHRIPCLVLRCLR